MFDIFYSEEFEHNYAGLPSFIQRKIEKQERLFRANPFHPSLHVEKLVPKKRELWSIRVDLSYRIIFRFLDRRRIVLLSVGRHDQMYRL